MKVVAISTLDERFLLSNYGTFFQHYALRCVLRSVGFSPFRVSNFLGRYERNGFLLAWSVDILRPFYWLIRRLPNWRLNYRRMIEEDLLNFKFLRDYRRLVGSFREQQDFCDDMIGIMGGDQILGTRLEKSWLTDIPPSGKCITYAASADWAEKSLDEEWCKFAERHFKRFSAIGIREYAGVALCKALVGPEQAVEHVADPVMLLDEKSYSSIAHKNSIFKCPTLFCYFVNIRSAEDLRIHEYVKLSRLLGCELKIAGIQGAELYVPAQYRIRLCPTEFLRALLDAEYVVTNSYHGSVFAALFKKNFLSIWQDCRPGTNQNERQREFMLGIGLGERWLDWRLGAENWSKMIEKPVDWGAVHTSIDDFRQFSKNWLMKSLGVSR